MNKVPAYVIQSIESHPDMFEQVLELAYAKLMATPKGKVTPELNQLSVFLTRMLNVMDTANEPVYSGDWFWLYDLLHDMALMYNAWEIALAKDTMVTVQPGLFNFIDDPRTDDGDFVDYIVALYPTKDFTWGVA